MKLKVKKSAEPPPAIKAIVDRVVAAPDEQLCEALSGLKWAYEKGDLYHWVPLLNRFDTYLDDHVATRRDLQMDVLATPPDPPFPTEGVMAVLTTTTIILENCSNKHLYQSAEHLSRLLACSNRNVVYTALLALVAFVRKTHASSARWQGFPQLNARLMLLAEGWGGREEGADLVACCSADVSKVQQALSRLTTLRFEYYDQRPSNGGMDGSRGRQVIEVTGLDESKDDTSTILRNIVSQYNIPIPLQYPLLCKLQLARHMGNMEGRRKSVLIRLLAFYVLFHSNPNHDELAHLSAAEPEFVSELVALLWAQDEVPLSIRTVAVRALAVQLLDRGRHNAVINAISGPGQSGVLSVLMHSSVSAIIEAGTPGTQPQSQPKCSIAFVESLLGLVQALVASSSGCTALQDSGVLPALLQLLKDTNAAHVSLVSLTVRIIESFLDLSPSSSPLLRELGGLTDMLARLTLEVLEGVRVPQEGPEDSLQTQLHYSRRLLIKSLLRAVTMVFYAPNGTATRPQEEESAELFMCLRVLFENPKRFGNSLFALAASVMTDLMHHDPLCFPLIDKAGLPEAFIKAVKAGMLPASEALCCVPSTLMALCLNTNGLNRVKEAQVLQCFIPVFTSKEYVKALQGDTPSALGAGLDELLRHAPALKDEGIRMLLEVFRRLCILGGDNKVLKLKFPPAEAAPPAAGPAAADADPAAAAGTGNQDSEEAAGDPMEVEGNAQTDAQPPTEAVATAQAEPASGAVPMEAAAGANAAAHEDADMAAVPDNAAAEAAHTADAIDAEVCGEVEEVIPPELEEQLKDPAAIETYLLECVYHAARMLENVVANQDQSRAFAAAGGVDLLLRLYSLPRMPPAFATLSGQHGLLGTFKNFTPHNAPSLSTAIATVLNKQLLVALKEAEALGCCNPCTLDADRRTEYVKLMARTDALIGLAGAVVRTAAPMLAQVGNKIPGTSDCTLTLASKLLQWITYQSCAAGTWLEQQAAQNKGSTPQNGGDKDVMLEETQASHLTNGIAAAVEDADMEDAGPSAPTAVAPTSASAVQANSPEKSAFLVLVHLHENIRQLCIASAKAVHVPARRREEPMTQPSGPMRVTSACLAVLLVDVVVMRHLPAEVHMPSSMEEVTAMSEQQLLTIMQYAGRQLDVWMHTLLDGRRRSCHTLVLNYLMKGKGLNSLQNVLRLARCVMEVAIGRDSSAESKGAPKLELTNPIGMVMTSMVTPNALLKCSEHVLMGTLALLEQLSKASMILGSPHADVLLVAPLTQAEGHDSDDAKDRTAAAAVRNVQHDILSLVMPLLLVHQNLLQCTPRCCDAVTSILTLCMHGTEGAPYARTVRAPPPVSQAMVGQIEEMGFPRNRAEEALRRVGNNVELAMEWLITHPAEEVPESPPAAAPSDEESMTQTLEQALQQPPVAAAKGSSGDSTPMQEDMQELPSHERLLDRALDILGKVPDSAFSVADLVNTLASNRQGADSAAIFARLVRRLHETQFQGAADKDALASHAQQLMPAAHLLAILVSESPANVEAVAKAGAADVALTLMDQWLQAVSGYADPMPFPVWLDALLLVLDVLLTAQRVPSPPAATGARGSTDAAAGDPAAPQAAEQNAPTAAADAPEAAVDAPDAGAAAPANTATTAAAAVDPADTEGSKRRQGSSTDPASSTNDELSDMLLKLWSPAGMLSEEQQRKAVEVAIKLLSQLQRWAAVWDTKGEHAKSDSTPDNSAQALTQLLASLTTRHDLALHVLQAGGLSVLLSLPHAALSSRLEQPLMTIFRHALEDSATLQAAMEAEIRNVLNSKTRPNERSFLRYGAPAPAPGVMPVKQFLNNLAPVVARDPRVFMEAVKATCILQESRSGYRQVMMALRKPKDKAANETQPASAAAAANAVPGAAGSAATPGTGKPPLTPAPPSGSAAATPANDRTARRGSKLGTEGKEGLGTKGEHLRTPKGTKRVASSFVEVMDTLTKAVLAYHARHSSTAVKAGTEDAGVASQSTSSAPGIAAAAAGPSTAPPTTPDAAAAADGEKQTVPQLNTDDQTAVVMQSWVLKMLAEFTLLYGGCVGVLLKRDLDGFGGPLPRGTPAKLSEAEAGQVLKHIMSVQLVETSEPVWGMQRLSELASFFLLAVCIRSAEGRRRIIHEIVSQLLAEGPRPGSRMAPAPAEVAALVPFHAPKGGHGPQPQQMRALVELVNQLLSGSHGGNSRANGASAHLSAEIPKAMRDAGMIKAVLRAFKLLDLDHPKATKSIHAMLRTLEMLTRSHLPRPLREVTSAIGGQEGAAGGQAATAAGQPEGQGGDAHAADAAHARPAAAPESEAGPQAFELAERALEAIDRQRGPGRRARLAFDDIQEAMEEALMGNLDEDYGEDTDGDHDDDDDGDDQDEDDDLEGASDEDMLDGDQDSDDVSEDLSGEDDSHSSEDDITGSEDEDDEHEMDAAFANAEEAMQHTSDDDEDDDEDEDESEDEEEEGFDPGVVEQAAQAFGQAFADDQDDGEDEMDEQEEYEEGETGQPEDWEYDEDEDEEELDDEDLDEDDGEGLARVPGGRRWRFFPHAGAQQLQDLLDQLVNGMGAGAGADRRRFRLTYRRDIMNTTEGDAAGERAGAAPTGQGAAGSSQHALLTRPTQSLVQRMTGRTMDLPSFPVGSNMMDRTMAEGLMSQLMADFPGNVRRLVIDPTAMQMPLMAMGGGVPRLEATRIIGTRPESRGHPWGPPEAAALGANSRGAAQPAANSLAWHLEEVMLNSLRGAGLVQAAEPPAVPPRPPTAPAPADAPAAATEAADAGNVPNTEQAAGPPADPASDAHMQTSPSETQQEEQAAVANTPAAGQTTVPAPASDIPPASPQPAPSTQDAPPLPPATQPLGQTDIMQALQAALAAATSQIPGLSEPVPSAPQQPQIPQEATLDPSAVAAAATPPAPPSVEDMELDDAPGRNAAGPSDRPAQEASAADADDAMQTGEPSADVPGPAQPEVGSAGDQREGAAASTGAAADDGIDPNFLEALPAELRAEVLASQAQQRPPPPEEEGLMDNIDPEFLAALPPEIQAEVLEQQRQQRRRQRLAAQAAAAAAAAPAAGGAAAAAAAGPADMDVASVLATFPPEVREEILLTDENVLAALPPALLAEAQALRERSLRHMRQQARVPVPMPMDFVGGRNRNRPLEQLFGAPNGGVGGAVARAAGEVLAGGTTAGPTPYMQLQPCPEIDDASLLLLLQLLRLNQMPAKTLLQRLLRNLITYPSLRDSLLRMLMGVLRSPLTHDEAVEGPSGSEVKMDTASGSEPMASSPQTRTAPASSVKLLIGADGEGLVVANSVSRRVLEMLSYLSKEHQSAAVQLIGMQVPQPAALLQWVQEHANNKAKDTQMDHDCSVQLTKDEQRAVEVLLSLLGRSFCTRSSAHLDAVCSLLEYTLVQAYNTVRQAAVKAELAAKEAAAKEAAEKEAAEKEAGPSGTGTEALPSDQQPAIAATSNRQGPEPGAGATPSNATPPVAAAAGAPLDETAAMDVGDGAGPSDASTSRPAAEGPYDESDPRHALQAIPQHLLRRVPELLGAPAVSESAYKKCLHWLNRYCRLLPDKQPFILSELAQNAIQMGQQMTSELPRADAAACANDKQAAGSALSMLGTLATQELRVIQALAALTSAAANGWTPGPEALPLTLQQREANVAVLERVSDALSPMWQALSQQASSIEAELKQAAQQQTAQPATAAAPQVRLLPARALPCLPLLEAYFVLCDARMTQHAELATARQAKEAPPPVPAAATPAPAVRTGSQGLGPIGGPLRQDSDTPMASAGSDTLSRVATAPPKLQTPQIDAQLPFLRFAEKHRMLLNSYVRHNSQLLEGSLRLLLKVPRLIEFDNKRSYFRGRVRASHDDRAYGSLRISVRREHVFEDSFHQLRLRSPEELRCKLNVQFTREEGIDAGGVTREWYQVMAREIFNPNFSLFVNVPENGTTFQPNPNSVVQNDEVRGTNHLDFFRFVGRIVGKALYDGQFIDAHFTRSFYKHMLGQQLTYEDIEAVDPEYYKNLKWMLENDISNVLDLTFSEEVDYFGRTEIVELKEGGAAIKVTEDNKREYVNLVARHRMTTAIKHQLNSFLLGFWELVPKSLIAIFNDHELELLISGLPEIDVDDLRANTEYRGYTAASPVIQWFWEVVRELGKEDLALLVQFVTGTSKVPLDGFKALQGVSGPQKFQIHKAYGPSNRLPSAHTCFNQLDLLEYENKEQLKERLLLAMHEGSEGFGFG